MLVNGNEVNIIVITFKKNLDIYFLKKYFQNNRVSIEKDPYGSDYVFMVFDVNITQENFYKLLLDLINQKVDFELNLDCDKEYVYENYIYKYNNDYITKKFVDISTDNGETMLKNIIFHEKTVDIKIVDLHD